MRNFMETDKNNVRLDMSELSTTPKIINKDVERIRNAERLARALRPYLSDTFEPQSLSTPATLRGRGKDKRICQLNAAYKYCFNLEKKIQELYAKENVLVPDEFKLVHSTLNSNHSDQTFLFDDDIFHTPIQKSTSLSTDESTATVSSIVSSSTNTGVPVTTKRSSILSTISPICGPQDHFIDDGTEEFPVKRRRVEDKKKLDLNNNVVNVPKSNSNEPILNNLEFRKHYFLRSTAIRIKNALSGVNESEQRPARRASNRKLNGSTHSSSRSSSVTTTPTEQRDLEPNISSLMEQIDNAELINLPQSDLDNLYKETNELTSNFTFINNS
ncbi:unnamed protein product [Brachionus calyciflorus]|uniref:Uncharacterized protein n=1 Tax=Brachionus calyciflorus TaxID=104777 RepID=A0A814E0D4_9BILA|nr:unnamed protein product [Brachionus calyciflorus]